MKKSLVVIILLLSIISLPSKVSATTLKEYEDLVAKYTAELKEKEAKIAKGKEEIEQVKKNINKITTQISQAETDIKKLEQEGKLNIDRLEEIMGQEKPNQIEKVKINAERFKKIFPKHLKTSQEKEDFLYMCVEEHNKRERKKEKER